MEVTLDLVKKLRVETGVGIMDCKEALKKADGDYDKAKQILRTEGKEFLARQTREANEGQVGAYIHHSGKVGVLVELVSNTDFAANSEDFQTFLKDLSMQIAAFKPRWVKPEDVPEEIVEEEREVLRQQAEKEGKPPSIVEKMVEGRLQKFFEENCLLKQGYIKNEDLKVEDVLGELGAKLGESIAVRRFVRYEIGEE
ncbi:MAG: elongation factor Ts [Candidatus Bipolaricaulota bacterium]